MLNKGRVLVVVRVGWQRQGSRQWNSLCKSPEEKKCRAYSGNKDPRRDEYGKAREVCRD